MTNKRGISNAQIERSRLLRHDSTFPERLLWGALRNGRLGGLKFRRQHPIGPFIVDFYCHQAKLVVELDGDSHIGRADADQRRTAYLEQLGLQVFRVSNDDLLHDKGAVMVAIARKAGLDWEAP